MDKGLHGLLRGAAQTHGWRIAVVEAGVARRYVEFAARVAGAAVRGRDAGWSRGSRVAVLAPNTAAFLEAYFALAGLGALCVPLNTRLAPPELAWILEDSEAVALLADTRLADLAHAALAASARPPALVWCGPERDDGRPHWAAWCASDASGWVPERCASDEPAQLYYTSGTTGNPKGVVLTHGNVGVHAQHAVLELGLGAHDVWGHFAPLFHLADAWATFAITLVGGRHVCVPWFEVEAVLDALERERVTITNLVPTMLNRLVHAEGIAARDLSSLRRVLSGGAPIAPELVRRIMQTFRTEYVQTYGMTETSPYLTLSLLSEELAALPEEQRFRLRAKTGRPFRGVELRVVDELGRPVPADGASVGEILARGPTVTPGYWKRPDATAAAFTADGFLRTGDLATLDRHGFLDIVDRKKDVIVTGGEKVYSTEVEHRLAEHPAVLEVAVFGEPDADWGERVRAALVLRAGHSAEPAELAAFCRARLAGFKVPRAFDFLPELPRTGSGKIAKRALRERSACRSAGPAPILLGSRAAMTTHEASSGPPRTPHVDFVRQKVAADVAGGIDGGRVHTRFPPEPNGYLHLGHAKSICLNFGLAAEFGGKCNLRFDDTNPTKESVEYVESIQRDVRWLGFDWQDRLYYASDYFERLYELAVQLVRQGDAYVCDLDGEAMRLGRGSLTQPGENSPGRSRSTAENLELFGRMRAGEFSEGACTLRARIDMASPNVLLRDPVLYRILHAQHHRTGDAWKIYPTYDWAHGQSDALEGITHSICTLEFENHRPLYDWFLDRLELPARPRQTEFARLQLSHTVLSKRKLLELVEGGHVTGWDDPRMPTLSGVRRLGYTPQALRAFCEQIGVTRVNGMVELGVLQNALREDLNRRAPRRMAVLDPLELMIENWPSGKVDLVEAQNNPEDPAAGSRQVPFGGRLFIEREDFRTDAPKKYFRLRPGGEVRLRYGYYVTATGFDSDANGKVTRVRCTYDPATRGGDSPDGRKVKGTIHWVSAEHAVERELRLYDPLFAVPDPGAVEEGRDWKEGLNPDSLRVVRARLEPSLADAAPGSHWQFERNGYFCVDTVDSRPGAPVFNRSVALRDSWAKIEAKG